MRTANALQFMISLHSCLVGGAGNLLALVPVADKRVDLLEIGIKILSSIRRDLFHQDTVNHITRRIPCGSAWHPPLVPSCLPPAVLCLRKAVVARKTLQLGEFRPAFLVRSTTAQSPESLT